MVQNGVLVTWRATGPYRLLLVFVEEDEPVLPEATGAAVRIVVHEYQTALNVPTCTEHKPLAPVQTKSDGMATCIPLNV